MKRIPCPITAERLKDLYTNQKQTDQAIVELLCSEGHDATLKRVRSWRKRFKIATLKRWERNEVEPITGELKSLLIGSMLGDGRIHFVGTGSRFEERHAPNQKAYLEWKAKRWGAWKQKMFVIDTHDGKFTSWIFLTKTHGSLNEYRDLFYEQRDKGWKVLKPELIDMVDAYSLAIWYLDDGHNGWWPEIAFGAKNGSLAVAKVIFAKFGLFPKWKQVKGDTGFFRFDSEAQADKFLKIIEPYVPKCMAYKLDFTKNNRGYKAEGYQIRQRCSPTVLRQMAAKGIPKDEMARKLGVGRATIRRHLKKHNISHPNDGSTGGQGLHYK